MSSLIKNSYTVSQKLKAIELSRSIGVCAASRQLSISKSSLSRWVSQKSEYLSVKPFKLHRRKLGNGRSPMFPFEESFLYDQIVSDRAAYTPLSLHEIRRRMVSLVSGKASVRAFTASYGWLRGFMKRYSLRRRSCTTRVIRPLASKSNISNLVSKQDKIGTFHEYLSAIISEWKRSNQEYDIWNMDETPIWLEMPPKTTVGIKGSKKIAMLTTGYTSARITAVLCCSSEGRKIDPLI
jgi:transposase-like protein